MNNVLTLIIKITTPTLRILFSTHQYSRIGKNDD